MERHERGMRGAEGWGRGWRKTVQKGHDEDRDLGPRRCAYRVLKRHDGLGRKCWCGRWSNRRESKDLEPQLEEKLRLDD